MATGGGGVCDFLLDLSFKLRDKADDLLPDGTDGEASDLEALDPSRAREELLSTDLGEDLNSLGPTQ